MSRCWSVHDHDQRSLKLAPTRTLTPTLTSPQVAYLYGAGFTTKDEMDLTIRPSIKNRYTCIIPSYHSGAIIYDA